MNALDSLAEFFAGMPRRSAGLSGRSGLRGRVDEILNDLEVPVTLDEDGDWHLESDVGPFLLVSEDGGDLVLIQKIGGAEGSLEDNATGMNFLLRMNFEARGAWFAMIDGDDEELMILTTRIPADEISRASVEAMLIDAMRLSRRLDEVMEEVPSEAPSVPESVSTAAADWYPDPRGEARLRYWDGSVWTEHTAA